MGLDRYARRLADVERRAGFGSDWLADGLRNGFATTRGRVEGPVLLHMARSLLRKPGAVPADRLAGTRALVAALEELGVQEWRPGDGM